MALHNIRDFDPDYRNVFDKENVLDYDLYSGNDKVGSIDDLLVDDDGRFRYFVIGTGFWVFGKKVLLPLGRARISHSDRRVYADGLTREQVEHLPEYKADMSIDYDQEEQIRSVYRPMGIGGVPVDSSAPLDASASLETPASTGYVGRSERIEGMSATPDYDRSSYSYDRDPDLYNVRDEAHPNLRLYEERLIASKQRYKTGEVTVGKRVETEQARVAVPVEKERVVIERVSPTDATAVAPGSVDAFREGEVARVEVYEETPDIRKEAFVREEVRVRKEVDRETVESEETLRKERLDVHTEGTPVIDNDPMPGSDRR